MKIQKRQIAGMNLVYKFYSFDYFLDAMERLGYESIELLPNAPHFYVPDLSASDMVCHSPENSRPSPDNHLLYSGSMQLSG